MYVIYKLNCKTEKKSYIGFTGFESGKENASDAIKDRFKAHARENTPLGVAISRYGIGDFKYDDLYVAITEQTARRLEHKYIEDFNTLVPYGYNQIP